MSAPKNRPRVAVLDDWQRIAETCADWSALRARAEVDFYHHPFGSETEAAEALAGYDAILAMRERTPFTDTLIQRLPRLRFFNMTGRRAAGLDAMSARGITVSITGGGEAGEDTAEHALALLLATARHVPVADRSIRTGGFQDNVPAGTRLAGRTLGILGLGLIGTRVAGYGRALGMEVIGWGRSLTPERAAQAGVTAVAFDALFERADAISIHLVLAPATRGMVGARELGLMRDGAILVNTSRAAIVDEAALLAALHGGRLRAALDVFAQEPLPAGHPLRSAPNSVLTPHLGYGTRINYEHFYRIGIENTLAFLDGAPIRVYQPALHGH